MLLCHQIFLLKVWFVSLAIRHLSLTFIKRRKMDFYSTEPPLPSKKYK